MTRELKSYVQPEVTDARVQRLWSGVAERLRTRRARAWRWAAVAGGLAVLGGAAFVVVRQGDMPAPSTASTPALHAGAKLETAAEPLTVKLGDGSSIELGSRTELAVTSSQPEAVSVSLSRGAVTCDVVHRRGREFSVVAGDVAVRVIGTKFTVKTGAGQLPRVEVNVLRGVVEVESRRRPGIVARVAAGQSWIQSAESEASPSASAAPLLAPPAPALSSSSSSSAAAAAAPSGPAPSAGGPSARELFEKAGDRRRAGDAGAAARAYEELLRLHPSDARASLAALELGRLRMDRLGDPAGAIAALERALASNIGPSFREDALARLVSVHAAQGSFAACRRARDRYLSSYPSGVHAPAVSTRCGSAK
jgi:hypothetical protein